MSNARLVRYIKDAKGDKVENKTRSVNITATQSAFIEEHNLNLSLFVRDSLDSFMKGSQMIDETKIEYRIRVRPEEIPLQGNVLQSGDKVQDFEAEQDIQRQLDAGNVWAWCSVEVIASIDGIEVDGRDYLGCCSYKSEDDFKACEYFEDMKREARGELLGKIQDFENKLNELRGGK